jgi:hypothetical protein
MFLFRCLAPSNDLDGESHVPRSREHTNALVEMLELGVLWDEYGLVGDMVVRIQAVAYLLYSPFFSLSQKTFHVRTSMNYSLQISSINLSKARLKITW